MNVRPPTDEPSVLSELDDHFVHQIAEPVRHVGTSDRNFYDRHYFNLHGGNDEFFVVLGLGQYPNLGTQDAFVSLRRGREQITLRSSRTLGDRADMACGPIRVEVLSGLKRLRVCIGPNEAGIEADVVFHGDHAPQLEPRQLHRVNGRVVHDVMRYCQTARCEGWIRMPGARFESPATALQGYRDRSWGIRAIGRPEPAGAEALVGQELNGLFRSTDFRRLHMGCRFDGFTVNVKLHEDRHGRRSLEEAMRLWHDGRPPEQLGAPTLELLRFTPDRRFVEQARVRFGEDGPVMEIDALLPLYLEAGTGYGNRPILDWIHGQYRGEDVTDVVRFDLDHADPVLAGPIDCLAALRMEGHAGRGLFEYTLFGCIDGFPGPGHFNAWR